MSKFGAHAFLWIDDWTVKKGNYAINEAAQFLVKAMDKLEAVGDN